jgi:hypothetical protein
MYYYVKIGARHDIPVVNFCPLAASHIQDIVESGSDRISGTRTYSQL